jgi:hypothetical protein
VATGSGGDAGTGPGGDSVTGALGAGAGVDPQPTRAAQTTTERKIIAEH